MFEGMNMSMLPEVMANTGFTTQVPQNLVEPWEKLLLTVELVEVLVRPIKRLLRKLQRVFAIAHQTQRDEVGVFHVRLDDHLERLARAPA